MNRNQDFMNIQNSTFAELNNHAMALPMASKIPIFDEDQNQLSKFSGIKAGINGEVLKVLDHKYSLVQHREVIETVSQTLTDLGLTGRANIVVSPNGGRMHLYMFFDQHAIRDDAQGIKYGVKITNSYDGSCALSFSFYGMRLICNNQFVIRNLLAGEYQVHRGIGNAKVEVAEMIRAVINKHQDFQDLVEQTLPQTFEWEALQYMLKKMIRHKLAFTHVQEIFKGIGVSIIRIEDRKKKTVKYDFIRESSYNPSKWALWNSFTAYCSHTPTLSYSLQQHIEKLSEEVLSAPLTVQVQN